MAATKMTNTQFETWVDSNVNTNGVGAITGAVLNEAFKNILLSIVPFVQKESRRNVALVAGPGRTIAFDTPFPAGTVYNLLYSVRDSDGNPVTVTIDPTLQTIIGFFIESPVDAILDFTATEIY